MKKTLLRCCESWFYIYSGVLDGSIQDIDLFERLKKSLSDFSEKAVAAGFGKQTIDLATYALIALMDELACTYSSAHGKGWSVQSLQLYYYGSNVAGDAFFEKLHFLLEEVNLNYPALSVYYLCLQLGFKGKYHHDQARLERYKASLSELFVLKPSGLKSPKGKQKSLPLWIVLITVLLFFLIVYLSFIFSMNEKLALVKTDVDTTVEQLQHVVNT